MIDYTIYVVDDETIIREGIASELEDAYSVFSFETAEDALGAFGEHPPDLILLDIQLPGMNGTEALPEFRALKNDVLIIMITAYEDIKLVIACMKNGAYDYIVKPIHMESLEIIIANALETIRLRKEIAQLQEEQIRENLPCFIGESRAIHDIMEKKIFGSSGDRVVVEERKYGDDKLTFVTDCKNPKAVSILIRGGTEHVVDELERGLHDALFVVKVALEDGKLTPGGGAAATAIAMTLREYAPNVGGREQMAIEAFANAIEVVPKTLSENAGLDPVDIILELRRKHKKGNRYAGVNVFTGEIDDMLKNNVIEPLRVGVQEVQASAEAATMILRIDDVIAAKTMEDKTKGSKGETSGTDEF